MARTLIPRGKLDVETVVDVLLLIGEPLPAVREGLSPRQMKQVYDWAIRVHLRASDNAIAVPPKPRCLG
jgi:hypothetical protein